MMDNESYMSESTPIFKLTQEDLQQTFFDISSDTEDKSFVTVFLSGFVSTTTLSLSSSSSSLSSSPSSTSSHGVDPTRLNSSSKSVMPCKIYLNEGVRKVIWVTKDPLKKTKRELSYSMNDVVGLSKPVLNHTHSMITMTLYTFSNSAGCGCSSPSVSGLYKKNYQFNLPISNKQTFSQIQLFYDLFNTILHGGEGTKRPRKLIVFLNPFGGSGEAKRIYCSVVDHMFSQANIEIIYYQTESSEHISNLSKEVDLSDVHGVVGVGGDGLINQIVNGFLSRTDAPSAMAIPIGLIPAGSQNALAISINGFKTIEESTFSIIRGETRNLDLIDAFYPEENRHVYSLITVAFGFIGDVLKESEIYRWMGPTRYQFCAVKQFIKNKSYRVRISYLPADCCDDNDEESWITLSHDEYDLVCGFNISGRSTQTAEQVPAQCDDGLITLLLIRSCSRLDTIKYLLHTARGTHDTLDYVQIIQAKSVKLVPMDPHRSSPFNIDGELHPTAPVTMKLLAKHSKTFVTAPLF